MEKVHFNYLNSMNHFQRKLLISQKLFAARKQIKTTFTSSPHEHFITKYKLGCSSTHTNEKIIIIK